MILLETLLGPATAPSPPVPPAFRQVFDAEARYVYHSLRRQGVRDADLEDLTHDVFVAAFRHYGDYDPARPIRPWLFGFVVRVASGYRQRARFRREVASDTIDRAACGPAADEQLTSSQMRALLLQALERLDEDRRAIFILHDLDEVPMPDIARQFGIPVPTGHSRLRLARQQLRGELDELERPKGAKR